MHRKTVASILAFTLTSTAAIVLAQTSSPPASPRVRVATAGRYITGRLVAVDIDSVAVVPDTANKAPVHIRLSSISELAISQGRRPRSASALASVGAGIGAGFFSFWVGRTMCGDTFFFGKCSHTAVRRAGVAGIAVGTAVGISVMRHLDRERWHEVPVESAAGLATANLEDGAHAR